VRKAAAEFFMTLSSGFDGEAFRTGKKGLKKEMTRRTLNLCPINFESSTPLEESRPVYAKEQDRLQRTVR
jgi:hypothetical protein